jgi:hypothetical protein
VIAKTFLQQLAARLPADNFINFTQAVHACEAIFGRTLNAMFAEYQVVRRRHINLLSTLRENGILAIGNEHDVWHVELSLDQISEQLKAHGASLIEREGKFAITDALPMSEQGISMAVHALQNKPGWEASFMRYEGDGRVKIDGTVNADELAKLLRLMRAATVPSPAKA